MKKWKIIISQNGWEYEGYAIITANVVEGTNDTIVADGVYIKFDEQIRDPKIIDEDE